MFGLMCFIMAIAIIGKIQFMLSSNVFLYTFKCFKIVEHHSYQFARVELQHFKG